MIIEDNDNMRNYIKDFVKGYFSEIIELKNGKEAVENYEFINPDLILMDIELIEMDGLSAAEKIKHNHPDAKIIFITNYNDEEYMQRAAKSGSIAYIVKENMHELKAQVEKISH